MITELERQTEVTAGRIRVNKGYRRHNSELISGQIRRVTQPIRRSSACMLLANAFIRPNASYCRVPDPKVAVNGKEACVQPVGLAPEKAICMSENLTNFCGMLEDGRCARP